METLKRHAFMGDAHTIKFLANHGAFWSPGSGLRIAVAATRSWGA